MTDESPSRATPKPALPAGGGPESRVRARHKPVSRKLALPELRLAGILLVLLLAIGGFDVYVHGSLEQTIELQAGNVLQATLDTAAQTVRTLLEADARSVENAARDPRLLAGASACLAEGAGTGSCARVAEILHTHSRSGRYASVRFIGSDGRVRVGSPLEDRIERARLTQLMAHAARGRAVFLRARRRARAVVIPLAAPVVLAHSQRVGALLFEVDLANLDSILRATRVGESGETYLFDREGRLLTESRFVPQLARLGLLPHASKSAVLTLTLRDPGRDLTRQGEPPGAARGRPPVGRLTKGVQAAVRGEAGSDLEGYRDYRGVPVLGSWRWLRGLHVGVVSEVDRAHAYRSLTTLQHLFNLLLGVLALALVGALGVAAVGLRLRARATRAEARAERFGQYVLEEKIGEGGMGVVYVARHALLRRKAAIKLLRPDRVDADALARFEVEAQMTSALTHPNTVEVYDFGRTESGDFYYVMEYLDGLDLQRLVDHFGPLPQARALHFLAQLCGSLAEAHAAGVIHRDIKPANLVACTRGGLADTLKVVDFGIAHVGRAEAHSLGTLEYMAPELLESKDAVSPRSDLYAVGILAYYLLTGSVPFAGENTREIVIAQVTRAPGPLSLSGDVPIDSTLAQAIHSCLAKNPSGRPSTAAHLQQMLARSALAGRWSRSDASQWWGVHTDKAQQLRVRKPLSSRQSVVLAATSTPLGRRS